MSSGQSQPQTAPLVYSVSSHVAHGSVGNRAVVFALEALGIRACAIHTVQMPFHPGHGPSNRLALPSYDLRTLLAELFTNRDLDRPSAILTGYFADAEQVRVVAEFIAEVRARIPDLLVACDPVIGDADGLYVEPETAEAIRDELILLADISTPNRHELAWLLGEYAASRIDRTVGQARRLGPRQVLVTSAPASAPKLFANLLVVGEDAWVAEHPALPGPRNGPGDLIAGLYCGHNLLRRAAHDALRRATAGVIGVLRRSPPLENAELMLAGSQDEVQSPTATITVRPLARAAGR